MKTQTFTQKHVFKTFNLLGILMVLMLCTNSLEAQTERIIEGVISDENGPLDGATVVLKDTAIYAVTDENGAFTFPQALKENDQLIVSSFGYNDKALTIDANTSSFNVTMDDYDIVIIGALRIGNNNTTKSKSN